MIFEWFKSQIFVSSCVTIAEQEWPWEYLNISGFIPEKRFGHSLLAYNNKLFIFGGGGSFSHTFGFRETFQDVEAFSLKENKWDMSLKPSGKLP